MIYTINELAKLSNVTTRTLRYYDQLGLLTPAQIGHNGYRYYNRENLLRLQQILFFRELDVPLKDIRNIIDRPDYDLVEALQKHRNALKQRAERVKTLIETIDEKPSSAGVTPHNTLNPSVNGAAIPNRKKKPLK
jgi:DNA-binding transcriptional MerR regulator